MAASAEDADDGGADEVVDGAVVDDVDGGFILARARHSAADVHVRQLYRV